MATLEYYDILLKPVITEKSMELMAEKKYTFLVHPDANKYQIKTAVERLFEGTSTQTAREREGVWSTASLRRPRRPL